MAPFGEVIAATGVKSRKGFIDKETDQETATGNFGVRQYNADEGRFTSVDPLWEQYRSQTPYHYSSNTPLVIKDPSGLAGNPMKDRPSDAPVDCWGGGGSSSPWNTTLGPRSPNMPVGVGYTPRSGGGGTRSGSTSGAATGPTGMAGMKSGGTSSKAAEAPKPSKPPKNRQKNPPHPDAQGAHTTFTRDRETGKVIKYDTYEPPKDSRNPNKWERTKAYQAEGGAHYNKFYDKWIETPHVNSSRVPGGVRGAHAWEIP